MGRCAVERATACAGGLGYGEDLGTLALRDPGVVVVVAGSGPATPALAAAAMADVKMTGVVGRQLETGQTYVEGLIQNEVYEAQNQRTHDYS